MIDVRNPRTGLIDFSIEETTPLEITQTASRMRGAQAAWDALGYDGRAEAMVALSRALEARFDAISAAVIKDTGRKRLAIGEVHAAIGALRGWAEQRPDRALFDDWVQGRSAPHIRHRPQYSPFPLVGVISPWNFPLTLAMIDAAPALLAGCAVLVKPSEITPRFAEPLRQAIADVPALEDVFVIVDGAADTGKAIVGAVDLICFTGSVATGRRVAIAAAERLIPAFLELGGKDPLIVLEGADLDAATDAALRGSVVSSGQACQSIERIYVARPIYDAFLARLTAKASQVRTSSADLAEGELGPIIFDKQTAVIESHISDAVTKGARRLTTEPLEDAGGVWVRPTVLADATHDMKVMTDETFGPVMPVMPFDTVEEALALANDTIFGLSGAVFAKDLETAEAVGRKLDVGAVSLNDAALTSLFYEAEKHAFKQSGLGGSRMGEAGFQRFLRRKALIANTQSPTPLSAFAEDAPPAH